MKKLPRWPAKSLIVADLVSILAGFMVFRTLCTKWQPEAFARWEWLRVVLGLCLLLPRNGFEILAQRCAVRHPKSVREWTALNLLVRLPFSILAMVLFLVIAHRTESDSAGMALLLAMTLPVQSVVPDLAARVQGRFAVVTLLHMCRSVIPAIACVGFPHFADSPERMAAWLLMAEAVVFTLWWFDAMRHGGLPGGKWARLLRRGHIPMTRRASDQTLSRWMRVSSWNFDAILLGALAPDFWARLAPARSLMMTAVVPLANYLGNVSPLLARERPDSIRRRFLQASRLAMGAGVGAVLLSAILAPLIVSTLFGASSPVNQETLVIFAARTGPIMILLLATNFWTALRNDERSRTFAMVHLGLCVASIGTGIFVDSPQFGYRAFVLFEAAIALMCVKARGGSLLTLKSMALRPGSRTLRGIYAASIGNRPVSARRRVRSGRSWGVESDA